ncbi:RF-1 domain-containing protein [Boeremia exigua]|uniref:RF-1 domain-containing protein n=1 Tax=Boeremia exigua TaxID=749465 RepID=UPI001E8CD3D2|nr:RF-1 domain-containing protein [Boeremia exigua]KAH6642378.1 RF-1 domain-containing protein [Boeremia exigua]
MRLSVYHTLRHAFHSSALLLSKQLPPRRVIPESEIIENFLKGSGPGGQKINKTSSAVQLKHIPTGIVVKYQDTRSRALNRKVARKLLQDRIEELELGDEARTKVKGREISKKKASSDKKKRRKYRALEEAKAGGEGAGELVELESDAGVELEDTGRVSDTQGGREGTDKAG